MDKTKFKFKPGQHLLKPFIPRKLKEVIKDVVSRVEDIGSEPRRKELFGEMEPMVPPLRMMFEGPRDYEVFKENGREFFEYLRRYCDLQPIHKILDIGCGIGRKTFPLVSYLNAQGSYDGLDIVPKGVEWLKAKVGTKHPNFRFHLTDVSNGYYNADGTIQAINYKFPFPDQSFDLVLMGSVFTQMLTEEVENYLSEIARVLKPGGHCFITYFLLNEESERLVDDGKATLRLKYHVGKCRVEDKNSVADAVAHRESDMRVLYERFGFDIKGDVLYGFWCGRENYLGYEDFIIAVKR